VLGKPVGNFSAQEYHTNYVARAWKAVCLSFKQLCAKYEIIVIEGAGSPAEVNLADHEIVNMRVAQMANAPVLLIADIDKGGALAAVVGTLELVLPEDRQRIAGIVINKFRGDLRLFQPAISFLEEKTGIPVLGVVPYFQGFSVQEEDTIPEGVVGRASSLSEAARDKKTKSSEVEIAVIYLPHISNFTDFDPLYEEEDVNLRYIGRGTPLGYPDLIIVPGSKNTIEDLVTLKRTNLAAEICDLAKKGVPVIGICGGFQMLGRTLADPYRTESSIPKEAGLGLLDITTTFAPEKVTTQVEGEVIGTGAFLASLQGERVKGYEIHLGRTELGFRAVPAFKIVFRSGEKVDFLDGAVSSNGLTWGTYIHGIFDNDIFRRHILDVLRVKKGLSPLTINPKGKKPTFFDKLEQDLDKLAAVVRGSLNMQKIYALINLPGPSRSSNLELRTSNFKLREGG
jgi:adenosylcobyric acid synthase